jgi:thymidylate synthase (FAD)
MLVNYCVQPRIIFEAWYYNKVTDIPNLLRYGQYVENDKYIISNLRALMYDLSKLQNIYKKLNKKFNLPAIDSDFWYNTNEKEIELIRKNFFTFRIKATIRDFRQHVRHRRAAYQELSRRYTTGKKVAFEFRYNAKWAEIINIEEKAKQDINLYYKAMEIGMKAEDARDILPVSLYSTIWTSYYPDGLKNYLALRTKTSAQKEIRQIADTMQEVIINNSKEQYEYH